ncbi:dTDP-glucose 4,6-dehydratase [Maribacter aquivivus]|uniref:dTDP-glucose 4,6-dehydratase n=1 Tax=Maribacter aquivivus TaxID=228958 RepID=A0A1M6KIF2_9FLAO|nr:dTDP-glucose 4,6-dehydratase [Maribacter aquivivus]SHJ58670.1 dTDP-glucose 4,6-dehydratase [Maribacter aquivivus]
MPELLTNGRVLITGGAGFIGSNFIPYFLEKNPNVKVVNLDKITYAGNLNNLDEINTHSNYTFIKGDICDYPLINKLFEDFNINGVINFAAESHVDNSIDSPSPFIKTNIEGTFNLLEVARKHWKEKEYRFHHISTDEVYGSLPKEGYFTEHSNYQPNSPYSASKASSDFLVRSYHHTYGMNVVTSNCSNNYGPKQHDEKLIPTIIRSAIQGMSIPIYGNGKNIRDWLFVKDHCIGIDKIYMQGVPGETYLLGGNNEYDNLTIATKLCEILDSKIPNVKGSYLNQIEFVQDRLGHDFRYAIDSSKISNQLGWKAFENFESGLEKTVDWYLNKYQS